MRLPRPVIDRLKLGVWSAVLSLLILEGAFRQPFIIAHLSRNKPVYDARVGFRPNPLDPDHDARGWRNSSALSRADIVVFGDSQTYGLYVPRDAAWPQRLSHLLHRSVYQMAFNGYGPAHYVPLLDEALALQPKVIIAAYYYGNDLYDSYAMVYRVGRFRRSAEDHALDSLASTDPKMREAIARTEGLDPDLFRSRYLNCLNPIQGTDPVRFVASPTGPRLRSSGYRSTLRQADILLTEHSALFAFVRLSLPQLLKRKTSRTAVRDYGPPLCIHYGDRGMRTIFNIGYRFVALRDADPRIVEGERISLLAFKYLAERSRRAGVHFYVVMLPTKETAFRRRVEVSLGDQPYLVALWKAEARARASAAAFFAREGIATVDTLPALEQVIDSGVNPYPEDADGHPARAGYDAIARTVAGGLEGDVGH